MALCFGCMKEINDEKICPNCGYTFPHNERKLDINDEAQLIKVESFKLDFSSPNDCQSYSELLEYAQKHNYKKGWAFYEAKRRGMIA